MRGADLVARALSAAGGRHMSTLSGNQIMSVYDACIDTAVELYHVRHEAAAVHMADAWGRLTGQPGVALVTACPGGFANTLSALYVAKMAESPMVLLSGHAPLGQVGRGAFQEMAQPVTKASWTVQDASQLGRDVARAIGPARSGRPGPVQVSLPSDLLEAQVDDGGSSGFIAVDDSGASVSPKDAARALETLLESRRPLVLAGPTLTRGRGPGLAASFAEKSRVPVVTMESPRGTNDPSLGAFVEVLPQADTVLLLGKRLDFTLGFGGPPALAGEWRLVQIDPAPQALEDTRRVLSDRSRLVLSTLAKPAVALEMLLSLAKERRRSDTDWYDEVQTAVSYRPPEWETLAASEQGPLHPVQIGRDVQDSLRGNDAVLVSDGGEYGQWRPGVPLGAPSLDQRARGSHRKRHSLRPGGPASLPECSGGDASRRRRPGVPRHGVRHCGTLQPALRCGGGKRRGVERRVSDTAQGLWARPSGGLRTAALAL